MGRCREIWEHKFISEPFENEAGEDSEIRPSRLSEDLFEQVSKCRSLCRMYSEPYYCEMLYLVAAKMRYRGFVYMVRRFGDECSCIVPTSDVFLMWLTHQVNLLQLDLYKNFIDVESFDANSLWISIQSIECRNAY